MSTSKPIKVKAKTKTFVHADRDAKVPSGLTIGVIEGAKHVGETSRGWAYLELRRSGAEFTVELPLAALEQLVTDLSDAITKLKEPLKGCDRTDCYYCNRGRYAKP
jgi:hypothetical protein